MCGKIKWQAGVGVVFFLFGAAPVEASRLWTLLGFGASTLDGSSVPLSASRHDTNTSLDMDMATQLPKSSTPPPGTMVSMDDMEFFHMGGPPQPMENTSFQDAPRAVFLVDPEILRQIVNSLDSHDMVEPSSTSLSRSLRSRDEEALDLFDESEDVTSFPHGFLLYGNGQDFKTFQRFSLAPSTYYKVIEAQEEIARPLVFLTKEDYDDFLDDMVRGGEESLNYLALTYVCEREMHLWLEGRVRLRRAFAFQDMAAYLWRCALEVRAQAIEDLSSLEVARGIGLHICVPAHEFAHGLRRAKQLYRSLEIERLPILSQQALPSPEVYMAMSGQEFLTLLSFVKKSPMVFSHAPSSLCLSSASWEDNQELVEDVVISARSASSFQGTHPSHEIMAVGMVGLTAAAICLFGVFGK